MPVSNELPLLLKEPAGVHPHQREETKRGTALALDEAVLNESFDDTRHFARIR